MVNTGYISTTCMINMIVNLGGSFLYIGSMENRQANNNFIPSNRLFTFLKCWATCISHYSHLYYPQNFEISQSRLKWKWYSSWLIYKSFKSSLQFKHYVLCLGLHVCCIIDLHLHLIHHYASHTIFTTTLIFIWFYIRRPTYCISFHVSFFL